MNSTGGRPDLSAVPSWKPLALTSLGHFVNDGTVFFIPVVGAILAVQRSESSLDIALTLAIFYATSSLVSPLVGRWADRTGRSGNLIGMGISILSAGLVGFGLSLEFLRGIPLVSIVFLSAFLGGFGSSFYHPLGAAVVQRAYPAANQGRALGLNGAMGSIGRAIYPVTFTLTVLVLGDPGSLVTFALFGLASALLISSGFRAPATSAGPGREPGNPVSARESITLGIIVLTAVALVRSVTTQALVAWLPTELAVDRGLGIGTSLGLALTGMYAAAIVGQPFFGWLVDRFERRLLFGITTAGAFLSALGWLLITGDLAFLGLIGFGFFTFSAFPLLMSIASDYVPTGSSALANALVFGLGASGGGAIGPLVVGYFLYGYYRNLNGVLEVVALVGLASSLLAATLPSVHRRGRIPLFG